MTDPEHVSDRLPGNWREQAHQEGQEGPPMPKHRRRLSVDWEKLARLTPSILGAIAKLIDAISRIIH